MAATNAFGRTLGLIVRMWWINVRIKF